MRVSERELRLVIINGKTGKELKCLLRDVPRIGDGIAIDNKKFYRVKEVVWDSHWYNQSSLYHEVRIYVESESKYYK